VEGPKHDLFEQFHQEKTYSKGVSPYTIRYYLCVARPFEPILARSTKAGMMERIQAMLSCGFHRSR
jgi:hypothetical protein